MPISGFKTKVFERTCIQLVDIWGHKYIYTCGFNTQYLQELQLNEFEKGKVFNLHPQNFPVLLSQEKVICFIFEIQMV